jgi:hypothetical protein
MNAKFLPTTRSQAWSATITYLKRSPSLQPVKQWFVWTGDNKHDMRDIVYQDMPALRITPDISGETKWIDEISHTTSIKFRHELWIGGTRVTDFIDYWGAVELAWFDATNQLFAELVPLRGWQKTITGPTPAPVDLPGGLIQYGVGTVTLYMDITTGE